MNEAQRRLLDIAEFNAINMIFADPSRDVMLIDNYAYVIDTSAQPPITAAAPLSIPLIMDNDSDFVFHYISGGAIIPGVGNSPSLMNPMPALNVQITDLASGRTYFSAPTPLPLIAGLNGFPFILTSPRTVKARTTLQVDLSPCVNAGTSFSAAFLVFSGARIFYKS